MAGGLTIDQLLAEAHMQPTPNDATRALAHGFAASLAREMPSCDRPVLGEVLLRVSTDFDGFVQLFVSKGMAPARAVGVVVKMLGVAGVELYTEGMSAEDVEARVLNTIQTELMRAETVTAIDDDLDGEAGAQC